MDKPGAIYYINCKAHGVDYVGETGRAAKERMYDHRVVPHKDSKRCHSLVKEKEQPQEDPIPVRKSSRKTQRKDYRAMDSGSNQLLSIGDTVVSKHMALHNHQEGDIDIKFLGFERNWYRRTTKEAIAIKKIKPTLNEDEGRYISPIYDPVPSKFNRGLVSKNLSSKLPRPHGSVKSNHY